MSLVRDVTNAMENWKEEYLNVRFFFDFVFFLVVCEEYFFFRVMDKTTPESARFKRNARFF